MEKQEIEGRKLLKSLLQAIHDEIETVWESYQMGMGIHIEALKEGQPLLMYYPVTQDYFTVYSGNSFLIGRIDDNDLRKDIIVTYTLARALIDSYRMNNELVQKYENIHWIFKETGNNVHKLLGEAHYLGLKNYSGSLKKYHYGLKKNVEDLLRKLRKKGVLSEEK